MLKQRVARLACRTAPSSEGHEHDLAGLEVQLTQRWEARQVSQRAHIQRWCSGAATDDLGTRPSLRFVSFNKAVMPEGSSAKWLARIQTLQGHKLR